MSRYLPDGVPAGSYDKVPAIALPDEHEVWAGAALWERLAEQGERQTSAAIAIDSYPGADLAGLVAAAHAAWPDALVIDVEEAAALPIREIDGLIAENLTDDRVFGVLGHQVLHQFYDPDRLEDVAAQIRCTDRRAVVIGWGAALVPHPFDTVVLADMPRWEIQLRLRKGATNWRSDNAGEDILRKYKRGYFVEWRVADRHKRSLFDRLDFVLDTTLGIEHAKLITADTFRAGMALAARQPFRVVPFFDPGVWGGQWMRDVFELEGEQNYAWCFDCVPEENSLLLKVGDEHVEVPALNVVFSHPRELLGELTFARFGAEFPIRFDFLDTMQGGNLSLQVHPLTDYIQNTFGMTYTQDESYYLLDAGPDAQVYLGIKDGVDPAEMSAALQRAATGDEQFAVTDYVNTYPARKHDHFPIPAGTVHCSGAESMVLEISATPYIFTFKMWDWGRVGLDGIPRPVHLEHALRNIQWNRDSDWTTSNLVGRVEQIGTGIGWVEERTGLHELEFIEVRRHWFTETVPHHTAGTVNVLNLVEGAEAIVESPTNDFEPFVVHYAETFIVPASVGGYTIGPHGPGIGQRLATLKAYVRGTERG